jgi:hypothetical protein
MMIRPAILAAIVLLFAIIGVFIFYAQPERSPTMGWCCTEFGKACNNADIIQCQEAGGFAFAAEEKSCARVCVASK